MRSSFLLPQYVSWHYSLALRSIIAISATLIWFLWHFFSVRLLTATLFSPWERIQEEHLKRFDIEGHLAAFTINILMRIVGAILRLVMIVIGLLGIVITFAGSVAVFVAWLALPLTILLSAIYGFLSLV